MEEYSELTQRKNMIISELNSLPERKLNLEKQLKEVEEEILNPDSYCNEIFTEKKFLDLFKTGVIYDINYFSKLVGTKLEHCFERISHSDSRDYYSNTYQCKYCGKKRSENFKR